MINLNKQRIAVYAYFSIVFTLIFGLSFAVKGNKITGSFILETAGNFIENISLFFAPIVIFGFLLSLAFSFFIIRHAQEIKKEIKPEKAKFFAAIVVVLLSISFVSFGLYFENSEGKITGHAIAEFNEDTDSISINGKTADYMGIALEGGGLYKSNNNIYLVKFDSRKAIDVKQDDNVYSWNENNLNYRLEVGDNEIEILEVQNEVGEWVRSTFDPNLKEELKTQAAKEQTEKAVKNLAYEATWQLLDLTLGKFAFGYVEDYCKEQYDSSDYPDGSNNPLSYNSNPGNSFAGQSNFQQTANNCIGNQTTVTAQARKSIISTAFTYQTSWTITPCKENVQYNIYLANSIDDRIGIASGTANKGIAKSESNRFSYAKNYQFICVWSSDGMIGDNGYACFNVV